ncbi:CPBP family glutamic-type intramembrane protease [Ohtaekwangia sp.]|uniref:CPBP family glutamic-type intramembrane protease n=1 Tax=Ohtaekwangia sp. TaxID=2066019 RepID=UPI002FDD5C36
MIYFLKRPYYIEERNTSISDNLKGFLIAYAVCMGAMFLLSPVLRILDLIITDTHHFSIYEQMLKTSSLIKIKYGNLTFLFVVLVGPFVEEVIFRLPLDLKKSSIALSIGVLTYRFTGNGFLTFDFLSVYTYLRLLFAIGLMILIFFYLPVSALSLIREKYFSYCFYFTAFIFAAVHLTNFYPFNSNVLLFYPFFVLPQFIMGLCIGYVRVNCGFFYGWLLHALINLPSLLMH